MPQSKLKPVKSLASIIVLALTLVACGPTPVPEPPPISSANPFKSQKPEKWWNGRVFYEIFVRSFYDSRHGYLSDDGIGDIQGLIDKLDYLNDGDPNTNDDLGIGGIWLMPIMESPSYHGYDVVDYYSINEDYGTLDDFKKLIEEAHKRDIKIIIDLVMNHSSNEHPWFENAIDPESEYHDYYLWTEHKKYYSGPWAQTVWHHLPWWQKGERFFEYYGYYGLFTKHMPDLNFTNPKVTAQMYRITEFWLKEIKVDGFRLDAIRHLIENDKIQEDTEGTHQWLRDYFKFYKSVNPNAMTVGEVWAEAEILASYVPNQMDLNFQFDVAEALIKSINFADARRLIEAYQAAEDIFKDSQYATFITNHDQLRAMSQFDKDVKKAKLAAGLLLTSPGVPFLYYGEEIGITGFKPDPNLRTPMQWTPEEYAGFSASSPWKDTKLTYKEVNVKSLKEDKESIWWHYQRLIKQRNNNPILHSGDFKILQTQNNAIYAFLRTFKDKSLLVLANMHERTQAKYSLNMQGFKFDEESEFFKSQELTDDINHPLKSLPPYSLSIIPLKR